jgi:hypothetical protein
MDEYNKKRETAPGPSDEPELVFHYDRARRLEKAAPSVRWLHEDRTKKRGFLGTLFPTKGLGIMALLVALSLVAYAIIGMTAGGGELPHEGSVAGHSFSLHAAREGARVKIVVLRGTKSPSAMPLELELRYGLEGGELSAWYDTVMPQSPGLESYEFEVEAGRGRAIVEIKLGGARLFLGANVAGGNP